MDDICSDNENNETDFTLCVICGEYGANNEMWYRCVICGQWAHSLCSANDSPTGYVCDFCI